MEQAKFTSKYYYVFVISFISLLTAWQYFILLATGGVFGAIPVIFQLFLLFVLVGEHRHTKILLQYWSGIFVVAAQLIKIVTKFLAYNGSQGASFFNTGLYFNILLLCSGLLIFFLAGIFIEINKTT